MQMLEEACRMVHPAAYLFMVCTFQGIPFLVRLLPEFHIQRPTDMLEENPLLTNSCLDNAFCRSPAWARSCTSQLSRLTAASTSSLDAFVSNSRHTSYEAEAHSLVATVIQAQCLSSHDIRSTIPGRIQSPTPSCHATPQLTRTETAQKVTQRIMHTCIAAFRCNSPSTKATLSAKAALSCCASCSERTARRSAFRARASLT